MCPYVSIKGINVSTYSLMIVCALFILNWIIVYGEKFNLEQIVNVLKIEVIGGIAAFLGAKMWDLIEEIYYTENYSLISWENFFESGLSFWGGVLAGTVGILLYKRKERELVEYSINKYIWTVPLFHAIWKTGCFFAGCCVGIFYTGFGAITYNGDIEQLVGKTVFPVQLFEAIGLLVISFILKKLGSKIFLLEIYFIAYGVFRIVVEGLRYHEHVEKISFATITSVIVIIYAMCIIMIKQIGKVSHEYKQ